MSAWGRVAPDAYRALDLHAHAVLHDVPLHDVWEVSLPGGGPDRTLADLRDMMSLEDIGREHRAVGFLFGFRSWLGRVFRLDEPKHEATRKNSDYLSRVPAAIRERSDPKPGAADGPFVVLYALEHETVAEIRNATVHAFSVMALTAEGADYRAHWAIYVAPVSRITPFYMALIAPFRRFLVYPVILRHVHRRWRETFGEKR